MIQLLVLFYTLTAALLLLAGLLHLLPRLGPGGHAASRAMTHAPALDVLVFLFTVAPPIVGAIIARPWWAALLIGVAAQVVSVLLWTMAHELANPGVRRGPRIVSTINGKVGRARNHAAVWWTALAVPIFAIIRLGEIILYPPLIWLVRFPRYRQAEWVNVSRHKFRGLVGHDLIWCLYCDWMTGVWSLGGEMLRNVESFWCPIRFSSTAKCENCKVDYPDIDGGWVDAGESIEQVARVLDEKYPGPGANSWFGHPARLTVNGAPVDEPVAPGAGTTA